MNKIEELRKIIEENDNIVFFGGAGVSVPSGIPDFRSADGIYSQAYKSVLNPETIISHSFFMRYPDEFYEFYKDKMIYEKAEPNDAHYALAELERCGKLNAVITQNIDGLHQKAGSKRVLELHGTIHYNYCMKCGKRYGLEYILNSKGVPKCSCGGIVRPDVVLYEEGLDGHTVEMSRAFVQAADVLIVGGTSLKVYPAAGYVREFVGKKLVLINKSATDMDSDADLVINDDIARVLREAVLL
ncbi:MAG: NAD-dependent protein deacylase [bacterium]|nr:NAD-dependent protein deacylase [bacterium]